MGSCQSKKNVKQPKKQLKNPQSSANLAPINTDDENENIDSGFQPNDTPQNANKAAEQLVDGRGSHFENPLSDIIEGSFQGNFVLVQALIKKHQIQDISTLKGYVGQVTLGSGSAAKTYENTEIWNPLLLAISQKHLTIVKLFFEQVLHFHKSNCLSKPYTLKQQKEKAFDYSKRVQRECFGLKLAIMNQDEATFKFLWNDNRLLWNLGHFGACLKKVVETKWNKGIRMMFSSPTSKVIIMSINDVPNFIKALHILGQLIEGFKSKQPQQYNKIKEYMFTRSFFLFCMFYEICHNLKQADTSYIDSCINKLSQDDIPFKHSDISLIFNQLDPKTMLRSTRKKFEEKFENRDDDIDDYLERLAQMFDNKSDKESNVQLLEDELDLFSYNSITVKGNSTNCLCEAMKRGFHYIIDYSFNEAFFNIRSIIRTVNRFEIENEAHTVMVSFLKHHQFDMEMFQKIYFYIIDVLQIVNLLDVFDFLKNMEAFEFVLTEPKFISLFESSLEMQKYVFTKEAMELKTSLKKEIHDILKQEPYQYYYGDIKRGNQGEDYSKLTVALLEQQKEERKQKINNSGDKTPIKASASQSSPPQTMSLIRLKQASEGNSPVGSDASITKIKKVKTGKSPKNSQKNQNIQQKNKTQNTKQLQLLSDRSESPEQYKIDDSQFISEGDSDDGNQQDKAKPRDSVAEMTLENKNKQVIEGSPKSRNNQQRDSMNSNNFKSQVSTLSKQGTGKDSAKRLNIFNKKSTMGHQQYDKKTTISKEYNPNELFAKGVVTSSPKMNNPQASPRQPYQFEIMKAAISQSNKDDYEKLAYNMVQSVKDNDMDSVKYLIQKFELTNVAWIKYGMQDKSKASFNDEGKSGKDSLFMSEYSGKQSPASNNSPKESCSYDTQMWNPILFAIYYKRIAILKHLTAGYQTNIVNAIRKPPPNEYTEYIVPLQKINMLGSPQGQGPLNNYVDQSLESQDQRYVSPNKNQAVTQYYPSSASVECFGIQLAIKNRDIQCLKFLWDDQQGVWEERHFAFVLDKVLEEHWDIGIGSIFRSQTSKVIFMSLNAEDKDNFLSSKIIDKITNSEYWHSSNNSPTKITEQQVKIVIQELQYEPYGPYAVLKFPKLFDSVKLLKVTLKCVKAEDICDFIVARKENLQHLTSYTKSYPGELKTKDALWAIVDKAKAIAKGQQKMPINPVKIVQLIKFGDVGKLKNYFMQDDNLNKQLKILNQLQGFEDAEYNKIFENNVVFIPKDDTINLIFAENSTMEWNPLIYAIFYQQMDAVKYFCEQEGVYMRNCLTAPFIIELEDEMDAGDEEMFMKEKTELISLVLCAMLNNKEILCYLWEKCSFIWNDIHMVILVNYLFEGQWQEGIEAILGSKNSHQIFHSMNMYEKEKFLKFCEKSITKQASLADYFRYQMSFNPYNAFYLPILINSDDLQNWDDNEDKKIYLQSMMQNFDLRSFSLMYKYNKSYVEEFVDLAPATGSKEVKAFGKKLMAFQQGISQLGKKK